jgi:hypothetical protein
MSNLLRLHATNPNKTCHVAPPRVHVAENEQTSATIPLPRNPGVFARSAPDAEERQAVHVGFRLRAKRWEKLLVIETGDDEEGPSVGNVSWQQHARRTQAGDT